MVKDITQIKADRFRFLNRAWELSEGDEYKPIDMWELGKELSLESKEVEKIIHYLEGEGLITFRSIGSQFCITHFGITQVEDAISNPDKPTQYFPAVNVIYVQNMTNSQIQQGTYNSNQMVITEDNKSKIIDILSEIKNSINSLNLDTQKQRDLNGEIETVEAQLKTSKPKNSIIKECLSSIRNILEQIGATLLATKIGSLISGL